MTKKYKKEHKSAIKEIRQDGQFIARVQLKEQMEKFVLSSLNIFIILAINLKQNLKQGRQTCSEGERNHGLAGQSRRRIPEDKTHEKLIIQILNKNFESIFLYQFFSTKNIYLQKKK